jgi:hypothetical protein
VRLTGLRVASLTGLAWFAACALAIAQPASESAPVQPPGPVIKSAMMLARLQWPDASFTQWSGFDFKPAQAGLEDRAVWAGTSLALRIDDDRVLYIFDSPWGFEGGPSRHRFEAWLPGPRLYVVSVSCSECHVTYLIDARDGAVSEIGGTPVLSPSGRYGMVYVWDAMGGVSPYLLDFGAHPPIRLGVPPGPNCENQTPSRILRAKPRWLDDSHVTFEGEPRTDDKDAAKQLLRIVDGKPEWEC